MVFAVLFLLRNPVQSEQTASCGSDDQSPGQMKSTASNGNANNKGYRSTCQEKSAVLGTNVKEARLCLREQRRRVGYVEDGVGKVTHLRWDPGSPGVPVDPGAQPLQVCPSRLVDPLVLVNPKHRRQPPHGIRFINDGNVGNN